MFKSIHVLATNSQLRSWFNFILTSLIHFRCTDRNGNRCPSKNGFINDNDNRFISGVLGWDFNLITSKVFVTCVRQLNTMFDFI